MLKRGVGVSEEGKGGRERGGGAKGEGSPEVTSLVAGGPAGILSLG